MCMCLFVALSRAQQDQQLSYFNDSAKYKLLSRIVHTFRLYIVCDYVCVTKW